MINAIITGFFTLILKLASLILYPFYVLFNAISPNFGDTLRYLILYVNTGASYIPFFIYFFGIPLGAIAVWLDYIILKYTFFAGYKSIKFLMNIWQKFKL